MSVRVTFVCDGCGAKADGTAPLARKFFGFNGTSHGWGQHRWANTPADVAPDGWVAADPYTQCTYCPECWASVIAPEPAATAAKP